MKNWIFWVGFLLAIWGQASPPLLAQGADEELSRVRTAIEAGRWMRMEVYLRLGMLEEAEQEGNALRSWGENRPDFWTLLGDVYAAHGRWDAAYEAYQQGRERDPQNRTLLLRLGHAALWIEAFEPARQAFEAVLRTRPTDPEAHYGLARLEALRGRPEAALAHLRICFEQGWIQPDAIRNDPVFAAVVRLPGFPR
jgi:predicted Zn-dependent protease